MKIPKEILEEFEIKVKGMVEGFFAGRHRSKVLGISPEFAGHRPYSEGDDIRRVDWKVFARKKKLYLKQFLDESEIPVVVLFDNTPSMTLFGKHDIARIIAGMVMFSANRLNYRFSFINFSGKFIPFNKGFHHLLKCYYETMEKGNGNFLETVYRTIFQVKKRSLVVVISDFEFEENEVQRGLEILMRFHDVVVLQVLSGEEWDFRYDGRVLVDIESGKRISIEPNSRQMYRERIRNWAKSIRNLVIQKNGRYSLIFSDSPLEVEFRKVIEVLGVV